MRNFTLFCFILIIASFISKHASAQTFTSNSGMSIILNSDSATKSVLISDMLQNRSGDMSPIIGTASWIDNNKRYHCSSLLSFDYGILPQLISPDLITKVQLVLFPVYMENQAIENENQSLKLTVRRVLVPWDDSVTTWENHPNSNLSDQVITSVSKKKKDKAVKINVTEIVKNMFRYGNNGFMICYSDSLQSTIVASHWFASAKYEIMKARPYLLISYEIPGIKGRFQDIPPLPLTANDKAELMQMYFRPEPVITPPEVKTTENNNKGNQ